jgi:AAA+ superfamily predicted ATPase
MMGNPQYLGKVLWGLMTSRPDELDPDIKSRAPVQIPIFDLEGEERKLFIKEMFKRKKIIIDNEALEQILIKTDYYSARDYRNFVAEVLAIRKKEKNISPLQVLNEWQASKSIKQERKFQELIAAQHCSYPTLLPDKYKKISDNDLSKLSEELKRKLY